VNYIRLLTEGKAGCLMLRLPEYDSFKVVEWQDKHIPTSELADDGFERMPHCTVAFGFVPGVEAAEVFDAAMKITAGQPIQFGLGTISRFDTNEKYDVIKVDVISEMLTSVHYALREVFGDKLEVTYDDFKPHMTLAYVRKGALKELDGNDSFYGQLFNGIDLIFSSPDHSDKEEFVLEPISEAVRRLSGR